MPAASFESPLQVVGYDGRLDSHLMSLSDDGDGFCWIEHDRLHIYRGGSLIGDIEVSDEYPMIVLSRDCRILGLCYVTEEEGKTTLLDGFL